MLEGTGDSAFMAEFNARAQQHHDEMWQKAMDQSGCYEAAPGEEVPITAEIPAEFRYHYDVLTNNGRIISLVGVSFYSSGAGTGYAMRSSTLTADLDRRRIYEHADFKVAPSDAPELNATIKAHFENLFFYSSYEDGLRYPIIRTPGMDTGWSYHLFEFEDIGFGIRNDSLMLVTHAIPLGNSSNDIYVVPIRKME